VKRKSNSIADEHAAVRPLFPALKQQEHVMAATTDRNSAEFQLGWNAALTAARDWHEAKARQAIVQSRRTRFPKNLEREAEVHIRRK
jgi:hypothetical protein